MAENTYVFFGLSFEADFLPFLLMWYCFGVYMSYVRRLSIFYSASTLHQELILAPRFKATPIQESVGLAGGLFVSVNHRKNVVRF